jgi:hypothetical protein
MFAEEWVLFPRPRDSPAGVAKKLGWLKLRWHPDVRRFIPEL